MKVILYHCIVECFWDSCVFMSVCEWSGEDVVTFKFKWNYLKSETLIYSQNNRQQETKTRKVGVSQGHALSPFIHIGQEDFRDVKVVGGV